MPPTSAKFVAYQDSCRDLFGSNPSLHVALENSDPIFHEAAVFVPSPTHDALFVTSNQFVPCSAAEMTILIHKLTRNGRDDTTWSLENIPDCDELMGNGGVNYPTTQSVLFCAQGTTKHPGGLITMHTEKPYTVKTLLTNFHGRLFNSTNDVVVAKDGTIWFTDPSYGHEQGFRPKPQLPCQVYRYDPIREDIRVVANGFGKPNGLCFSPNEKTMYITDTEWIRGDGDTNDMRASHM
jgi:gluconolactonase